ncbi:hypothetical protein [Cellulomonas septica]|uniref:Nucleotidyltransferase-like protein n=1 Tax=Cellulomonas septica TaxID=285080 RepID=A0ABX1K0T2_9CELL|nr:hypothetical protein [Cellulomonas septica]NKY39170.1 hypothetical protein [Cellulomonas septica]
MPERPLLDVPTPPGGWGPPWPNVAEIADVLPHHTWTLVGGLMTQLHAATHDVDGVRPTNDVDVVLHVETTPGAPAAAAEALESLGYHVVDPFDPRETTAHRFRRGHQSVDLVTVAEDVVDVLIADHAPPRAVSRLRGRTMVAIEGGTQALQRTVNASLSIVDGVRTTVSTPSVLGALVLKAAAYRTDSRDPERHLMDAAVLLARLDDPYDAREQFKGSDRSRMLLLARHLVEEGPQWRRLPSTAARDGQAALRILTT